MSGAMVAQESSGLNPKQLRFAQAIASGTKPVDAARLAGYQAPQTESYRLLRHPNVLKYLKRSREALINGDLANVALSTMRDLMTNPDTPAEVRRKAAKDVLEMAGHGVKDQQKQLVNPDKPVNEMSLDELDQYAAEARRRLDDMRNVTKTAAETLEQTAEPIENIEETDR